MITSSFCPLGRERIAFFISFEQHFELFKLDTFVHIVETNILKRVKVCYIAPFYSRCLKCFEIVYSFNTHCVQTAVCLTEPLP